MGEAKRAILDQQRLHQVFFVTLLLKGAFALAEITAGVAVHFATQQRILRVVEHLTREELLEDPRDVIANYLLQSAHHFSAGPRAFTAVYLLSHGVIKLWLIAGLLRSKLSYYPVAIAVFGLFILYQLYRYDLTHSPWLLLITVIDALVIALTWHEHRYWRRSAGMPRPR